MHCIMHIFIACCKIWEDHIYAYFCNSTGNLLYVFSLQICWICFIACQCLTGQSCDDAFQINSTCYKIHKEKVRWFTAVNRCLSNNATLAVFDDDVRRYFPSSLLSHIAWIGLVKSWWTWPGFGCCALKTCISVTLLDVILLVSHRDGRTSLPLYVFPITGQYRHDARNCVRYKKKQTKKLY